MVLKRLLKGIFKKPVQQEPEAVSEEISYSNLENDFNQKSSEISLEEKRLIEEIKSSLDSSRHGALEKVKSLEELDVYSSNIQDKAKAVIKENLDNYVSLYKGFFENLVSLKAGSLSLLLSKVDGLLKDFEKKSYKNYQKVAFLFENKIREVNAEVIKVSDYLKKVSKQNSSLVWKSEAFASVGSKFKEIADLREKVNSSEETINSFDEKISEEEQEVERIKKKIEEVKQSEVYKRNLEKEKQVKEKIREIDSDIESLKKSIDFKALGDAFHTDKDKIQLVKAYKSNFASKFKEDWGESLRGILESFGKRDLVSQIDKIGDKRQSLLDLQNSFENSGLENLESNLESSRLRIEELKSDKEKENKNRQKFLEKIDELEREIVNSLKQSGFKVVG
ncbi:MAG: hypothetical protein ABEI74_01700 [Candidatus Pacearchaeota archaeon]